MTGYVRLELRRFRRTPGFLVFTVLMPLLSYLVFTNISGLTGQTKAGAATYTMVTMAGYGAIGALLNYASGVVEDRSIGWLRQLRLTPLSPVRVVYGKAITGMVLALPPVVALCVAAVAVNGVHLRATQWLVIVPLLWLGAVPFVLLGLAIGFLSSRTTAQPLTLLVYLGLSVVGGLWLPLAALPAPVAAVGRLLPTHAYADLSVRVAFGAPPSVGDVVLLGAWLAVFTVLAVIGYRRSVRRVD
jgi:ABC-2 type transport system permease protein